MWLSSEDSREAGKYHIDRAPYQRGPLDAMSDHRVERVTLVWASQLGKTIILLIIIGYYMDQEPSPILYVMPTLPLARTFSKRRITPLLNNVPVLRGKVKEARAKDSTNNALEKSFPGGVLTIVGAKSAASLVSNPIRIVLADERDKWNIAAGDAGDPFALAVQRTQNYDNRKVVDLGSPGVKDISPLEESLEASWQFKFHVPCPKCGLFQVLMLSGLKWEKDKHGKVSHARYECESCKVLIEETEKPKMLRAGKWMTEREGVKYTLEEAINAGASHIGFWLNALVSPWLSWKDFAQQWTNAKRSNNPEILKQAINEKLAEWWDDKQAVAPPSHELAKKVETYTRVPSRAVVLTAAVDVQDTHLIMLIVGWGENEERWHVHKELIPGKPTDPRTWALLDKELAKTYTHESGVELSIACMTVDSGNWTEHVYRYCKERQTRRVFAVKGFAGPRPIVDRPKPKGRSKTLLYDVGVDTVKSIIYQHLQIPKSDVAVAGCMHFNQECDYEYFQSLTSEKLVLRKGKHAWVKIRANEILDVWVYNHAAYKILNPNIEAFEKDVKKRAEKKAEKRAEEPTKQKPKKKRRQSNWATNF